MRIIQLFIICLVGGFTTIAEFQNRKEWTIFGIELFDAVPVILLFILTGIYLTKNIDLYNENKKIGSLIPSISGLLFLALTFAHKMIRSHLDNSPTFFTAVNYDLGNDGGFTLDFKTNNHLKGIKIDHFSSTYYWGSFTKHGDTLLLDLPLDFKMGKIALIQNDSLQFIDDTIHFHVHKPYP